MAPDESRPEAGNGAFTAAGDTGELDWAYQSDPGLQRLHNEDFVVTHIPDASLGPVDRGPLFVVCDGLGGHAAGEVASRLAAEAAVATWATGSSGPASPSLRTAVRDANLAVLDASLAKQQQGMGTTLVAVTLAGRQAHIAHVGDSRAYHLRDGTCTQVTSDHSRVAEMVRMRLLTPEQAVNHPGRSMLTRSLGASMTVQVDLDTVDIRTGDVILLCSDGLWDVVSRKEIAAIGSSDPAGDWNAPDVCRAFVDLALKRGAPDNVTCLVARISGEQPFPGGGAKRGIFRRGRA